MLQQEGTRNLARFISVAHENGLKVPFVHLNSWNASSIWEKSDTQKDYLNQTNDSIKICGQNGVETVILHAANKSISTVYEPNQTGIDCMNQLLETAEKSNIKIALENLDDKYFEHFEYLLEKINSKNFGFCFDSGHWHLYQPEVDLLGKYGNRLMAVHLQSNTGKQELQASRRLSNDLHLLPFDGHVDFEKVAKGIASSIYKGPIMIESTRKRYKEDHLENYYPGIPPEQFLKEAHTRAQRLSAMILDFRKSIYISGAGEDNGVVF